VVGNLLKNGNARGIATASGSSVFTLLLYLLLQASGVIGNGSKGVANEKFLNIERNLREIKQQLKCISGLKVKVDLLWAGKEKDAR